jgi:hypothetical protein
MERGAAVVATVRIEGQSGSSTEFEGTLIAQASTFSEDKIRWMEILLYRRDGGGWVLHRVSKSIVYHQLDGGCRRRRGELSGTPVLVSELQRGAEPCRECDPPWPEDMPPGVRVRFEFPRHTLDTCHSAAEVVDRLTIDQKTGRRYWSAPVTEVITKAAVAAEEFASVPARGGVIKID